MRLMGHMHPRRVVNVLRTVSSALAWSTYGVSYRW